MLTTLEPSWLARLCCRLFGHRANVRGLIDPRQRWCGRCGRRLRDLCLREEET